jgi:uncharacterized protein with NAD-binding domain and iron-sulfur cluster
VKRPFQVHPTVVVWGGGVAGLTVAHELADRGFDVFVVEKEAYQTVYPHLGGMAATQDCTQDRAPAFKPGKGDPKIENDPEIEKGPGLLHGEHGFRFFPSYYQHVFDTMQRIPIYASITSHPAQAPAVGNLRPAYPQGSEPGAPPASAAESGAPPASTAESGAPPASAVPVKPGMPLEPDSAVEPDIPLEPASAVPVKPDMPLEPDSAVEPDISVEPDIPLEPDLVALVDALTSRVSLSMNRTVYDNVLPCQMQAYTGDKGRPALVFPRQAPVGAAELFGSLATARDAGFSPSDLNTFFGRIMRYMATCPERRAKEFEDISAYEFLVGWDPRTGIQRYHYTREFEKQIEKMPKVLAAFDSKYGDARTNLDTYVQLQMPLTTTGAKHDGVLNGPTTYAWFIPWQRHLMALGVKFAVANLISLSLKDGNKIVANFDNFQAPKGIEIPEDPTYVVVATDAPAAAEVTKDITKLGKVGQVGVLDKLETFVNSSPPDEGPRGQRRADPRDPRSGCGEKPWDRFQTLTGIQFYFDTSVQLVEGHIYFRDAEWGLSSINQQMFWQYRPTLRNNGYASILSVDIGSWHTKSKAGKTAAESTSDEIAEEVWRQITKGLTGDDSSTGILPTPRFYTLDANIVFGDNRLPSHNKTPYLIPIKADWDNRPGARPWNPQGPPNTPEEKQDNVWQAAHGGYQVHWNSLVFAGTWTKTFTRMTSMEAACESGRHAVNAILDHWVYTQSGKSDERGEGVCLPWRMPYALDRQVGSGSVLQPTPAGDYCKIFDIEHNEPPEFRLVRELDKWCLDRKLPHPWELLGIDTANSISSWLTSSTSKAYDSYSAAGMPGLEQLTAYLRYWRAYLEDLYDCAREPDEPKAGGKAKASSNLDPFGLAAFMPWLKPSS